MALLRFENHTWEILEERICPLRKKNNIRHIRDVDTKEEFAIKSCTVEQHDREKVYVNRFHHPHVLSLLFAWDLYIVSEWCEGGSLLDLLQKRKHFDENETRNWGKQIVKGMMYLHEQGLIHRDLKLANLLVDSQGWIQIGDFDLAIWECDSQDAKCGGTPNYMAPEIICRTGHPSYASDIWSFGVVLYFMLVGYCPYDPLKTNSMHILKKNISNNHFTWPSSPVLSEHAKQCIYLILVMDPSLRLSWNQILTTVYMTTEIDELSSSFLKSLTLG